MSSFNAIFDKNRLVLARQLAGIRKNELAAKAGVSASAITTWESGARIPTMENIKALADAFSLPPSFFEVNAEYQHTKSQDVETINVLLPVAHRIFGRFGQLRSFSATRQKPIRTLCMMWRGHSLGI